MKRLFLVTLLALVVLVPTACCRHKAACQGGTAAEGADPACGQEVVKPVDQKPGEQKKMEVYINDDVVVQVVNKLVAVHGEVSKPRIEIGVWQVARFWQESDGSPADFAAFCQDQFISDQAKLALLLDRFRISFEAISGHAVAMTRKLREPTDLATFETLPVDLLFASLNPFDHLSEDSFATKVAFSALLNFPLLDTSEPKDLTRAEWAGVRLAQTFARRIPGNIAVNTTKAYAAAEDYIARYNIHMNGVVNEDGSRPFPEGLKLISHWGLRDHIKGLYSDPVGNLDDQMTILKVMERIVNQEIPLAVIDNGNAVWNPRTNVATDKEGKALDAAREPDNRYQKILDVFHAERQVDKYSPMYPTHMDRRFKLDREITEKRVSDMLTAVIGSETMKKVAGLIKGRLGRDLQPFDIWYDGFKARASLDENALNGKVSAKYSDVASFKADMPAMLASLGFTPENAAYLQKFIEVDPARGAGHAMGAGMRTDAAHLRTRVPEKGMDYKGYNIALHELGHCVEQVYSLNKIDDTLLDGVPNTAFTEAFAFIFQSRDLDVLGEGNPDPNIRALKSLDAFWSTVEIGSVGLLDMQMWNWLYANPDATPQQLREAVVAMAKDLWNKYFAPVFGVKDSPILAIYSHMIAYGLYLPDYAVGFLIQAQIEDFIKDRNLATEMERMCVQGRISPDYWMKGAVGAPLSPQPMIDAAEKALEILK
jgi:hypothetical protein